MNQTNNKKGNYYNTYTGTDTNNDGIGDTPNIITNENTDNYPLMNPVNIDRIPQPKIES
jgi:nitrous oxidase accessory protein NosD